MGFPMWAKHLIDLLDYGLFPMWAKCHVGALYFMNKLSIRILCFLFLQFNGSRHFSFAAWADYWTFSNVDYVPAAWNHSYLHLSLHRNCVCWKKDFGIKYEWRVKIIAKKCYLWTKSYLTIYLLYILCKNDGHKSQKTKVKTKVL